MLNLAYVELSHRSNCTTTALFCKMEDLKYQLYESTVVSATVNAAVLLCICCGVFFLLAFVKSQQKTDLAFYW